MSICELGKVILFEIKLESLGALSLKEVSFILYCTTLATTFRAGRETHSFIFPHISSHFSIFKILR